MRWLWILIFIPAVAFAGENCSMFGGKCRDVCAQNETAELGAFIDCTDRQECCVAVEMPKSDTTKCCVYSLDARNFGPSNCIVSEKGICLKGTGFPDECTTLSYCK